MAIRVYCPDCEQSFRVEDRFAGRRGRCPECGTVVDVPDDDFPDHRPRRRPTPADHLPAWRRVSFGFLMQQGAALLLLLAVGLIVAAGLMVDHGDPDAEPPVVQDAEPPIIQQVALISGGIVMLCGFGLQAAGRVVSAAAPVRAPKAIGLVAAVLSVLQLVTGSLFTVLIVIIASDPQQAAGPDMAVAVLVGLGMFGWMALVAGSESCHCFAVASVGRVLRSDGAKLMGRGLGVMAAVGGLLGICTMCGIGNWLDANDPNGQNAAFNQQEEQVMLVFMIGSGALCALYLLFDIVLLQQGKSAVARIPTDEGERAGSDADWE